MEVVFTSEGDMLLTNFKAERIGRLAFIAAMNTAQIAVEEFRNAVIVTPASCDGEALTTFFRHANENEVLAALNKAGIVCDSRHENAASFA